MLRDGIFILSMEHQVLIALELLIAAICSAIIGIDRERSDHDAGLRTHMLVGVGACLFTALSIYAFPVGLDEDNVAVGPGDSGRVAAQVVSGIGFLGAGMIIERKNGIKNLTTAASIWATAAVGMAVGTGAWALAFFGSVMIWLILGLIKRWSMQLNPKSSRKVITEVTDNQPDPVNRSDS